MRNIMVTITAIVTVTALACVSLPVHAEVCTCPDIASASGIPAKCGPWHVPRGRFTATSSCTDNTYGVCDYTASWTQFSCCHYPACSKDYGVTFKNCTGVNGNKPAITCW